MCVGGGMGEVPLECVSSTLSHLKCESLGELNGTLKTTETPPILRLGNTFHIAFHKCLYIDHV